MEYWEDMEILLESDTTRKVKYIVNFIVAAFFYIMVS
jgi:hypothetical protein